MKLTGWETMNKFYVRLLLISFCLHVFVLLIPAQALASNATSIQKKEYIYAASVEFNKEKNTLQIKGMIKVNKYDLGNFYKTIEIKGCTFTNFNWSNKDREQIDCDDMDNIEYLNVQLPTGKSREQGEFYEYNVSETSKNYEHKGFKYKNNKYYIINEKVNKKTSLQQLIITLLDTHFINDNCLNNSCYTLEKEGNTNNILEFKAVVAAQPTGNTGAVSKPDVADPTTDVADPSTDVADPSTDVADPTMDVADPTTDALSGFLQSKSNDQKVLHFFSPRELAGYMKGECIQDNSDHIQDGRDDYCQQALYLLKKRAVVNNTSEYFRLMEKDDQTIHIDWYSPTWENSLALVLLGLDSKDKLVQLLKGVAEHPQCTENKFTCTWTLTKQYWLWLIIIIVTIMISLMLLALYIARINRVNANKKMSLTKQKNSTQQSDISEISNIEKFNKRINDTFECLNDNNSNIKKRDVVWRSGDAWWGQEFEGNEDAKAFCLAVACAIVESIEPGNILTKEEERKIRQASIMFAQALNDSSPSYKDFIIEGTVSNMIVAVALLVKTTDKKDVIENMFGFKGADSDLKIISHIRNYSNGMKEGQEKAPKECIKKEYVQDDIWVAPCKSFDLAYNDDEITVSKIQDNDNKKNKMIDEIKNLKTIKIGKENEIKNLDKEVKELEIFKERIDEIEKLFKKNDEIQFDEVNNVFATIADTIGMSFSPSLAQINTLKTDDTLSKINTLVSKIHEAGKKPQNSNSAKLGAFKGYVDSFVDKAFSEKNKIFSDANDSEVRKIAFSAYDLLYRIHWMLDEESDDYLDNIGCLCSQLVIYAGYWLLQQHKQTLVYSTSGKSSPYNPGASADTALYGDEFYHKFEKKALLALTYMFDLSDGSFERYKKLWSADIKGRDDFIDSYYNLLNKPREDQSIKHPPVEITQFSMTYYKEDEDRNVPNKVPGMKVILKDKTLN